jgi:tRNA threonylcarbamoyl adenosine modification protein YeaZ
MNVLALDTSMGACGVCVLRAEGEHRIAVLREARMTRGHAEALMPMLAAAMEEARLDYADLDLIAATLGPGSFTGVRIAIAAARALALVTPARLWGTDSLSVMAKAALMAGAIPDPDRPFAVAVDARADHLYVGLYAGDGQKLAGPVLIAPEDAAAMLPADALTAIGSGAAHLAEAARIRGHEIAAAAPSLEPSAAALAELALAATETMPTLHPLYLRPPDAKPQAAASIPRQE